MCCVVKANVYGRASRSLVVYRLRWNRVELFGLETGQTDSFARTEGAVSVCASRPGAKPDVPAAALRVRGNVVLRAELVPLAKARAVYMGVVRFSRALSSLQGAPRYDGYRLGCRLNGA